MSDTETVEVVEVVEVVETVEAARQLAPVRTAPRVQPFTSPAEYLLSFVAAQRGDTAAAQRITAVMAEQGLSDNPGIVPAPIVGDVINAIDAARPVVASSRSLPMPAAGSTFSRPKIGTHTNVGKQTAEFDELASRAMTVAGLPVTKGTYGGALRISFQDRDWTDPALLGLVIDDLRDQYAIQTETACATAFATAVTATEGIGTAPDAETTLKGLYEAAAKVAAGCGELPDTIWAAPSEWALLGSIVDASKRPLFPSMGPVNAAGTLEASSWSGNPLGLRLVVSQRLAPGTMIVGRSKYLETFEQIGGQLSATNVTTLSFDVAFYGYFSELVTVPGAFCKITQTAPATAASRSK